MHSVKHFCVVALHWLAMWRCAQSAPGGLSTLWVKKTSYSCR